MTQVSRWIQQHIYSEVDILIRKSLVSFSQEPIVALSPIEFEPIALESSKNDKAIRKKPAGLGGDGLGVQVHFCPTLDFWYLHVRT